MKLNYPPNKIVRMFYDKSNLYCVAKKDVHFHAIIVFIFGLVVLVSLLAIFSTTSLDWDKPFWKTTPPEPAAPTASSELGNYEMIHTSLRSPYFRRRFELDIDEDDTLNPVVV
jgi:hypothetical protein